LKQIHIPQLNFEVALQAVANNQQLAHKLLAIFIEQLPDYQSAITNYLSSKNFLELQNCIHKLNSASQYIGAPELKQLVSELDGKINFLSKQSNDILVDEISLLLSILSQIQSEKKYLA
jgi:two-component system sensor histidine kinase BarA